MRRFVIECRSGNVSSRTLTGELKIKKMNFSQLALITKMLYLPTVFLAGCWQGVSFSRVLSKGWGLPNLIPSNHILKVVRYKTSRRIQRLRTWGAAGTRFRLPQKSREGWPSHETRFSKANLERPPTAHSVCNELDCGEFSKRTLFPEGKWANCGNPSASKAFFWLR